MKAIKLVNSPNGKIVKKVLVNRSRSGHHLGLNAPQGHSRVNVSPFRNSIGLKNYQEGSVTHKQSELSGPLNEDYFQTPNGQETHKKEDRKPTNFLAKNFINIQKQIIDKHGSGQETKQTCGWQSEYATTQSSKYSGSNETKLGYAESEYGVSGYQSPTFKIKKLEKEKGVQKKKTFDNFEKILKAQEVIQENRNRHKLERQLYEQIIQNLKKEASVVKSSRFLKDKLSSKLKNSGSMETEEGESSNQL